VENLEDILGAMDVLLTMNQEQQQAIAEHIKTLKRQNEQLERAGDSLPKVVKAAVSEEMKESAHLAKSAMSEAITPLIDRLTRDIEKATDRAADEKRLLKQAVQGFSWKWLLIASFATLTASAAGALILSGYLAIWWNRAELESLTAQKAVMMENIAALDKVKGQIKLETCKGRPCVGTDESEGFSKGKQIYRWMKGVY
jgi:DNA repair exonuclease SbcCD ATPase subunit